MINFAGYEWDTSYNWSQDSGNDINGQQWAPKNASVGENGSRLNLKEENVRDHTVLSF